jgi:hypothetical protein
MTRVYAKGWRLGRDGDTSIPKKSGDFPKPCSHPAHEPPSMMVFLEGMYRHRCPGCGQVTELRVIRPRCSVRGGDNDRQA